MNRRPPRPPRPDTLLPYTTLFRSYILVNNASYFHYGLLTDMPEPVVDKMIDVGLKGALWCLQAATPHLVARGGGAVINLSSVAVSVAIKHASVYSCTKGARDTLTRQPAVELGDRKRGDAGKRVYISVERGGRRVNKNKK